jgi:hypothetical protein
MVKGDSNLPQVVLARAAASRFSSRLDGRYNQSDEDANDHNDHKQLDEGERRSFFHGIISLG